MGWSSSCTTATARPAGRSAWSRTCCGSCASTSGSRPSCSRATRPRSDAARAAAGLLRGGLRPEEVARAVRRSGARVVHAHNLHPAFGWRALAAARSAGARVVLHLHQYRLVCAIGVCFTRGAECTRCHGRDTLSGSAPELSRQPARVRRLRAALALWQRRLLAAGRRGDRAQRVRTRAAARARRPAVVGAPARAGAARVRPGATPRSPSGGREPMRSSSRVWRPRRESTSRSTPAAWRACGWSWPATDRSATLLRRRAGKN